MEYDSNDSAAQGAAELLFLSPKVRRGFCSTGASAECSCASRQLLANFNLVIRLAVNLQKFSQNISIV